ncbi:MAG: sulfide/dihydroorotate dehydrogenase-like FAD/NAD-binding protein [Firmicutes bacterium]|uniref:Sulfide/dihydroorotate dehydrogenase-like FAD/NAD-binding protein n=1 Tax=Candidatus Stercoripulliclostridium pullicola TaxID=2840953 RepID=A0A940DHF4_9FIRM|nr:sulfide/dihydroorotate dehydrogenase-like FAD/NAD-binding protein [Candidatus Stercoripulliclostridium pullicola]
MYLIEAKRTLAENVNEYVIAAPEAARNAKPGQFIILRVDSEGERVPFTICDINRTLGTVTILVQTVGATTAKLAELGAGDYIADFVGPLGNPTDLTGYGKAMLVGGGIGGAVIYPQAKYLASIGKPATVVLGARNESLLMYEREMGNFASDLHIMTDDGSKGGKGFVTDKVRELLGKEKYDVVMAVGPLMMMKAVCDVTREFGVHTIVSMNSVMVDGTGMCGCCRVTVGGERKYACVDGPEFDGHLVDFDEARLRAGFYKEQEAEHMCRIRGGKK